MNRKHSIAPMMAAVAAAFALTACDRADEDRTAGERVDETVAKAERSAEEARSDASRGWEETKSEAREAGRDLKEGARDLGDKTTDAVSDATITASVNAKLAQDPDLSAMKIDVDTSNGRVALKGTAPSEEAKQRAEQIASSVDGVNGVENRLSIERRDNS
jgi:osmotically-inducible protein OsmY